MEENNNQNIEKQHKKADKGTVFVKIIAGFATLLMLAGSVITLVYALIDG